MFKRFPEKLNPLYALRRAAFGLANWRRRRFKDIDYIVLMLPASLPPLPEARGWLRRRLLGAPPLSLWELDRIFEQIANDPRPKGVVLHLRGLRMSLADLQTLRESIRRLQARNKRVVLFTQDYDSTVYYVGSIANDIILQNAGEVSTTGLFSQATFLKDTFAMLGIALDSVAISPFKGAVDQFTRDSISPEGKQQLDWLLDSRFEQIVNGIAQGRKMTPDAVRAMIDGAPYTDDDALAAGYVDAVMTEEGLGAYLGTKHLVTWAKAEKRLVLQWRKRSGQYVAVLPINGLMIPGESATPPGNIPLPFIGEPRVGDLTVVRQIRQLMQDKRAAAVVLYVESGGGAVSVAEAITSALHELAKDRPLVVYMNSVAASGGYHIATPAQWIVAQPGTITGSIGVLRFKPVTSGVWDKLRANVMGFSRGANAAIFSDTQPFTDEQRAWVRRSVEHIYAQFLQHVANGRKMSPEAVDAVGGGRVWTGAQAKDYGLVDELGDLRVALRKARTLANLPDDCPVMVVAGKGKSLPPQLAAQPNPAAALGYLHENFEALTGSVLTILPIRLNDAP